MSDQPRQPQDRERLRDRRDDEAPAEKPTGAEPAGADVEGHVRRRRDEETPDVEGHVRKQ